MKSPIGYRWYCLAVLTLIYISNIADRYVISTLIEPIKAELHLSDSAIGFLTGTALALFYTGMGIPLGMVADRVNRRNLIAVSIAIWSIMTAACGAAHTFGQLMAARIGVGVGEAGGTPASQSMLADLFPPQRRALVMSVFALGAAVGSMAGSVLGGSVGEAYGWRAALFVLAVPGLVFAVFLRLTVREPPRGTFDAGTAPVSASSLGQTLRFIREQRALLHVLLGTSVVTFWGWGLLWWTPSFLIRSYGISIHEAGALMGAINGVAGTIGIILGALLTHKWGRNDPRWQSWIIALATLLGTGISLAAYLTPSQGVTTLCLWLFVPTVYLNIGPSLAMAQSLSLPGMRGLVCAILLFGANIANLALAPQLIGLASDLLGGGLQLGPESLRYALAGASLSGIWASYHFWIAGKAMDRIPPAGVVGSMGDVT